MRLTRIKLASLWALLLLSLVCSVPLWAQTATPESLPAREAIQARVEEVDQELGQFEGDAGAPRRLKLEELRSLLQRQLLQLGELEQIDSAAPTLPPEQATSYSLELYDGLLDQIEAEKQTARTSQLALAEAQRAQSQAQERYDKQGERRRAVQEELQQAPPPERRADLEEALAAVEVELRLAKAALELTQIQQALAKSRAEAAERNQLALTQALGRVRGKVNFDREALQNKLTELAKKTSALQTRQQEAQDRLKTRETLLEKARLHLEIEAPGEPAAAQAVRNRESWVRLSRRQIEIHEEQSRHLAAERTLWERRFQLWNAEPEPKTLETWYEEARTELEGAARSRELRQAQLNDVRTSLAELSSRLTAPALSPEMRTELSLEEQSLRLRESMLNEALQELALFHSLANRFYNELDRERQTVDWSERWGAFKAQFSAFWNTELYSVGDSTVTLRKFFVAIILLFAGLWAARRLVTQLRVKFLSKLKINTNAQTVIEKLLYYLMVIFVFLFALRVVNIPLTIFTFLGGSLAIAVGFGAQNILNNFISGLILMVERPIKVGDMIEVGGVLGVVEEIGGRSTRVKRYNGIHVVVPNSVLLENNVVNWTLENTTFRTQVNVGVAYGSPVDEVFEKLEEALAAQPRILRVPAPDIIFAEFGDNALHFEIHFWVTADSPMEKKRLESQFRRTIDRLFNEAGLVIAFPQRDVHLDTLRPLEVRLTGPEEPPKKKKKKS